MIKSCSVELSTKMFITSGPNQMPRTVASDRGLYCLTMSHKKEARLIWVNFRSIYSILVLLSGALRLIQCLEVVHPISYVFELEHTISYDQTVLYQGP